jgi:hypothetical protein
MGWKVERVAIDAPAEAPARGPRQSKEDLERNRLHYFRTPSRSSWLRIRQRCVEHLQQECTTATLPFANKIWMLFGFELFACLRRGQFDVIARTLRRDCAHKSTELGYRTQLEAVAEHTGWKPLELEKRLEETTRGRRHDRLDAFMAAWIANLRPKDLHAYGDRKNPNDAIWVPRSKEAARPR